MAVKKVDLGRVKGDTGPRGEAATVRIGSVTHGPAAKVSNSGSQTNAILDFVLPIDGGHHHDSRYLARGTPVPIANGGTGASTAAAARNALGLGNTTGALPIANGGTGASNLEGIWNNVRLVPASQVHTTDDNGKVRFTTGRYPGKILFVIPALCSTGTSVRVDDPYTDGFTVTIFQGTEPLKKVPVRLNFIYGVEWLH